MTPPDPAAIALLIDRQAILDCVNRYCCGVDRLDRKMMLSAYHPDAIDDHGHIRARADIFIDFVIARHRAGLTLSHQHHITSHMVEIDGDVAHGTTYYLYSATAPGEPPQLSLHSGRYIDRFERRDGRWAIAARVCLLEWSGEMAPVDATRLIPAPVTGGAARDRSDLQYRRPLVVVES